MSLVRYIARRSLLLTVSVNDQVTLELPVKYAGVMPSRQAIATSRESMAGVRETYYYRGKASYSVALIPVVSGVADAVRMFLDSVEDGQVFSFAPVGTLSTPSPAYRNAVFDPPQYTFGPHPDRQDLTQFSPLTIIEVP
jgi:hypothetical protein